MFRGLGRAAPSGSAAESAPRQPVRLTDRLASLQGPSEPRAVLARYAGLTGAPDESGKKRRERGLTKSGNARVRRGQWHRDKVPPVTRMLGLALFARRFSRQLRAGILHQRIEYPRAHLRLRKNKEFLGVKCRAKSPRARWHATSASTQDE